MKLRGLTTKWILREAVKAILPAEILTRKKMGFPVPFSAWMRGGGAGVARDVLLDSRAASAASSIPRRSNALLDAHATGAGRRRRRALEPAQPRALVPHVHRRRRRSRRCTPASSTARRLARVTVLRATA